MTVVLADMPIAWWTFWLVAVAAVFIGLVAALTRSALQADREQEAPASPHTPSEP